tara:strand:+ start:1471 stop:2151 length:681 start_codon:yes stop_codon:yes gene_type:complete
MPKVGKKKFPYTEKGKDDATKARKTAAKRMQAKAKFKTEDAGKKQKKIPSDPIEHIRTLYGTGKPNDRVKKERKRLYDRYVKQGKLEPIYPTLLEGLIDGKKVPERHIENRNTALNHPDLWARQANAASIAALGARDRYTETGESPLYDDQEIGQRKQSIPHIGEDLEDMADRQAAALQKKHERHQESRLEHVPKTFFAADKETPERREYTEELAEWRKKHGKKGS